MGPNRATQKFLTSSTLPALPVHELSDDNKGQPSDLFSFPVSPPPCASLVVPFHPHHHGRIVVIKLVSIFLSISVEARTGIVDVRAEQCLEQ